MLTAKQNLGFLYEPYAHSCDSSDLRRPLVCAGTVAKYGEAEGRRAKCVQKHQRRQTYCKIADLSQQLDRASREKDTKKVEELAQSIDELESKLDPEYPLLLDRLWNIGPTSRDAREILSILNKLDEFCG